MDKWQDKFKELELSFQELFECPVCFGTMDSTLKLCINGHGVCNSCASKIKKCPTCQQELAGLLQNTLLGQVLERLPKLCPYTDKGCDNVVSDQEHQTYCEYRPTECRKESCVWKGCVKDLLDHVRDCDKGNDLREVLLNHEESQYYILDINKTEAFFTPIIFQNQVFWKYFQRNGETKCIYHQLYHTPTSKPSCNYYLVISFKKGDIKFEHSCKATVYTNDPNENYVKTGLIIPDCEMKRFLKPGSNQEYEYTLKLVKEDIS